jgi:hypothetical protein
VAEIKKGREIRGKFIGRKIVRRKSSQTDNIPFVFKAKIFFEEEMISEIFEKKKTHPCNY